MYTVTREFHFCYGHRLLNYNGKCAHLHGHNGKVEITIARETLDDMGMVMDFTDLKKSVGTWIDEHLDHKTVLAKEDPLSKILVDFGEPVCLLDVNPTAENFARMIFEQIESFGFPVQKVTFWETEKCFAVYQNNSIQER